MRWEHYFLQRQAGHHPAAHTKPVCARGEARCQEGGQDPAALGLPRLAGGSGVAACG